MRRTGVLVVASILVLALVPTVGLADCAKHEKAVNTAEAAEANGAVEAGTVKVGCAKTAAKAAMLAKNAEGGCAKSTAALIALAKEMGCEETAALAAKAEKGDDKAKAELIEVVQAMMAGTASKKDDEPSLAQLASWAESGCAKSTAALIARAKQAGCPKTAQLAANAEGGCTKSRAALIAMLKEQDEAATN